MKLKARVYDIGVEFQYLQEEDAQRIAKIVQQLGKHQENIA